EIGNWELFSGLSASQKSRCDRPSFSRLTCATACIALGRMIPKVFLSGSLRSSLALAGAALMLEARADVKLPGLFSDHMVLQQGMRVPVWGWANEGEKVTVAFRGKKVSTTARKGKWMVRLPSQKA